MSRSKKDLQIQSTIHHIDDLSRSILCSFLDHSELKNLSETCSDYANSTRAKRCLQACVYGQQADVEKMLQANPEILLNSNITATAYSGKPIHNLTIFQAALCEGDVDMCNMMKPYFDQLENGHSKLIRQFHAIFLKDFDEKEIEELGVDGCLKQFLLIQEQNAFSFEPMMTAIQTASAQDIKNALDKDYSKGSALDQAFNAFREEFQKLSFSEKVFNPFHLLKAFECYVLHFDTLNSDQRDLFWRQVIGYTQRYLPACYAQAFVQGLYSIVEEKAPLKRSFQFQNDPVKFFPLKEVQDGEVPVGLGYDWVATPPTGRAAIARVCSVCWRCARAGAVRLGGGCRDLFQTKISSLVELHSSARGRLSP